jgi:hypothetical protein
MCGAALRVSGETSAAPAKEKHGKAEEKRETEKPKTEKRKYSDEFYEVC